MSPASVHVDFWQLVSQAKGLIAQNLELLSSNGLNPFNNNKIQIEKPLNMLNLESLDQFTVAFVIIVHCSIDIVLRALSESILLLQVSDFQMSIWGQVHSSSLRGWAGGVAGTACFPQAAASEGSGQPAAWQHIHWATVGKANKPRGTQSWCECII